MICSKTDWSYLAGLFDGEGTFSIYQNSGNYHTTMTGERKQYTFTNHRVEITNTNIELMQWLISHFGGVFYGHRRAKPQHRVAYGWRPKGKKNTETLLLSILPYLVIKRRQANFILQYIRLERGDIEKRRALMLECQTLNKRGLSLTTNTLGTDDESVMIESDPVGDYGRAPAVTQDA